MASPRKLTPRSFLGAIVSQWKMLSFWPVYFLCFLAVERLIPRDFYWPMHHPLDDLIPFREEFILPYVFWYVFMVGSLAYTLMTDTRAFRRENAFMIVTFGFASVLFFLFPNCQNHRPEILPRENFLSGIVALLYAVDTSTNVCPSLHVCGAIGCALGLGETKRFGTPLGKAILWLLAALVTVSTVFVKQHSVVDVFWGLVLSLAAWLLVYRIRWDRKDGAAASRRRQN